MSEKILFVAPHPDDETLGCGGAILRHRDEGDDIHWMIVTCMSPEGGYSKEQIEKRGAEIGSVKEAYGFSSVHELGFPTVTLDTVPMAEMVGAVAKVVKELSPEVIYVPFRGDAHSDHAVVFDAVAACSKWFRYPSIRKVMVYETLSETDFGYGERMGFRPNVFVDISPYLEHKIKILRLFEGEIREHPFPRSVEAIRGLAKVRGAASGFSAAEAFMLIRESIG